MRHTCQETPVNYHPIDQLSQPYSRDNSRHCLYHSVLRSMNHNQSETDAGFRESLSAAYVAHLSWPVAKGAKRPTTLSPDRSNAVTIISVDFVSTIRSVSPAIAGKAPLWRVARGHRLKQSVPFQSHRVPPCPPLPHESNVTAATTAASIFLHICILHKCRLVIIIFTHAT